MFTPRTKRLFERAVEISLKAHQGFVGTEHLLLAILFDKDSIATAILRALQVDVDAMAEEIAESLVAGSGGELDAVSTEKDEPAGARFCAEKGENRNEDKDLEELSKFGVNLNRLAEEGRLDPVIGRKNEIDRVIQILSRRTKNNPVLIGEPGVGKSAVVEGLAQAIVKGLSLIHI